MDPARRARWEEIKHLLLTRDFRNGTPEDVAIIREWAELVEKIQRMVWP